LDTIGGTRYGQRNPQDLGFNFDVGQVNDQITGLIPELRNRYITEPVITPDLVPNFYPFLGGGGGGGSDLLGLPTRQGRRKRLIKNPLASPEDMLGMGGGMLDGII
jgi:hypothetical protein